MKVIDDENVIHIISNVLNTMDYRLISHGERVAYLVWKIMAYENKPINEIRAAIELSLMHDIGAYKTEEIDTMLSFDSGYAWAHSVYGYTFLKYLSPLSSYADCILYHHVPFEKLANVSCEHPYITSLIHLCDRIDVMSGHDTHFHHRLSKDKVKGQFDERQVEIFLQLDRQDKLIEKLKDESYLDEIMDFFTGLQFDEDTKTKYLEMLAYSIDFNSEHMVMHTIMAVELSLEIARRMGYKGLALKEIEYGCLLHDIGKVKVPIHILEKQGTLTSEEMDIMRKHVEYSEELLADYLPEKIFYIAVRHHEKLNGLGYPHGLTAKDLTIPQRIVAVADIMSALLGKRSYKESMSCEDAVRILSKMKENGELDQDIIELIEENAEMIIQNARSNGERMLSVYKHMLYEYQLFNNYQELNERVGAKA